MPGSLEVSNCVVFYGALGRRHFRHLSRMDRSLARNAPLDRAVALSLAEVPVARTRWAAAY